MSTPTQHIAESTLEAKPEGQVGPAASPGNAPANVSANYQYWRDHGSSWADEYDARKRDQVYYHIQELMLVEYLRETAKLLGRPIRVLEFGCGVGRHLRNLSQVLGVEIHGYDQSATMVGEMGRWAEPSWIEQRVKVGLPTGRLPYADDYFDVVYTAEVLVHVRPEDLPGVLRELCRVARGQVFHIETSPEHQLVSNEHDGCWWHDLPSVYTGIDRVCERLEGGYLAHAPYRVRLEASFPCFLWDTRTLAMYRRMDQDIRTGFDVLRGDRQGWNEAARRNAEALEKSFAELAQAREQHELAINRLEREREELGERVRILTSRLDDLLAQGERLVGERDTLRDQLEQTRDRLEFLEESLRQMRAGDGLPSGDGRVRALEREIARARAEAWRATAREAAVMRRVQEMLRLP